MRQHTGTLTAACAALFACAFASASCSSLKPTVSVKELMRFVIDPLADNIFDAVKTEVGPKGTVETVPKTEEDWEKVRIGGVSMVETAELLKMVRPFTPPGDKNNSEGPDAVELSPEEIMAKVEKDPVE